MSWNGIMQITEISHLDINGNVKWKQENVKNLLHYQGEEFILQSCFYGGKNSTIIPDYYYLGLDNRQNINLDDTIDDLIAEPSGGGYERQEIASHGEFSLTFQQNRYVALSPIVAFQATTNSWGPVSNLFLACEVNGSYKLISTAKLASPRIIEPGESTTLRIKMQIRDEEA